MIKFILSSAEYVKSSPKGRRRGTWKGARGGGDGEGGKGRLLANSRTVRAVLPSEESGNVSHGQGRVEIKAGTL